MTKCICQCHQNGWFSTPCKCIMYGCPIIYKDLFERYDMKITLQDSTSDIKKLEESVDHIKKASVHWVDNFNVRIDKLEKLVNALEQQINKYEFKPYKCPVCDGTAYSRNFMKDGGFKLSECKVCKATGVMWS